MELFKGGTARHADHLLDNFTLLNLTYFLNREKLKSVTSFSDLVQEDSSRKLGKPELVENLSATEDKQSAVENLLVTRWLSKC